MHPKAMRRVSLPTAVARPALRTTIVFVLLALFAAPLSALTQELPQTPSDVLNRLGSMRVQVKELNGSSLSNAILTLHTEMSVPTGINPIRRTDGFEFQRLLPGRYIVEASSTGFHPARQLVELSSAGQTEVVMFFLKPLGAIGEASYAPETGAFTPKAQRETQTALRDLQSRKYRDAQKHLNAALKAAPGNAQIHYLMGMTCVLTDRASEAQLYLEKALSLDPRHLQSFLALGNLRYQNGDYTAARELFDRVPAISPTSWQAHWMLAKCDLRLRNFSSARSHAERAFELGREKAVGVQLLMAEALTGLGEYRQASGILGAYLQDHPKDANAEKIRGWIAELERATEVAATPAPVVATAPLKTADAAIAEALPGAPFTKDSWVPPDAEAAVPPVVQGVACPLSQVLAGAAKRTEALVTHLEQFSALEHYESVEIEPNGQVVNPFSRAFNYLVFIRQIRPDLHTMEEVREQNKVVTQLPGRIQDLGSPAVAMIFDPRYQDDFEMKCEGLGQWKGQATWLVHFQQRRDRPVRLRNFVFAKNEYPIHLRGRAWISAESFQMVHLETDLLEPIPSIQLRREHMAVDYQLVPFPKSNVELWLPQQVDVYYDFRGRFYHHYHRFSDFELFTVESSQQIGKPKGRQPVRTEKSK
jgi:tetratricopeptide (TPR) repeat protein